MKRKPSCVPPVNKGIIIPGSRRAQVIAALFQNGPSTVKELQTAKLPQFSCKQISDTLVDLVANNHVTVHGEQVKFKPSTYKVEKPKLVTSVFDWRGKIALKPKPHAKESLYVF
jgi:hypothetical protein